MNVNSSNEAYAIEMRGITKRFPGVTALDDANFAVKEGEIHALVGENGAGKSTLIKILGGVHSANHGTIRLHGRAVNIANPHEALKNGVSVIHQELMLVPDLTVGQNIFLGREPRVAGLINWRQLYRQTTDVLDRFDLDVDPRTKVRKLGIARQQMVEIARAMSLNTSVIVMDEPTATLTLHEIDHLFELIARLKDAHVSVVYISHRMEEVFRIADRTTVLRDGRTIDTVNTADTDGAEIIRMMVGRKIDAMFEKENVPRDEPALSLANVTTRRVRDVSFDVRRGEILGIAGLMGSGRTEVAQAVFGIDPLIGGEIRVFGEPVAFRAPREAIDAGVGLLTEDRKSSGIVPDLSVAGNTTLPVLNKISPAGIIRRKQQKQIAAKYVETLRVKTPTLVVRIKNLSGGNQQKVLLSRCLAAQAKVLLLDEPTRGIDVGAKQEVYHLISRLASEGIAIVFISSELREILAMSDRIAVMHRGTVAGVLDREDASQERILYLATGGE